MTHGLRARRDLLELRHPPIDDFSFPRGDQRGECPGVEPGRCPPAAGRSMLSQEPKLTKRLAQRPGTISLMGSRAPCRLRARGLPAS
jgi:hypothetical protein